VNENALSGQRVRIPESAIDPYVAHTARVVDHLLGGVTNFDADRRAAEAAGLAVGGMEVARASACGARVFLRQVVGYLAGPAGVRQFLDVGTGVPRPGGVHLVARAVAPDARVVHVDTDPIVLAHAHQLVGAGPPGTAAYLHCDVRHPEEILDRAAATLDLDEPVGVIFSAVLHHLPDADDPHTVVKRLVGPLVPGSHLAVSHLTGDLLPAEVTALVRSVPRTARYTLTPRPEAEVVRLFDGLDLVAPGVVPIDQWRPDQWPRATDGRLHLGGVGRKP
jgi:hypothetical protein